jgi:hypothetical protein
MASARVKPLNIADFTGGLNLRADAFQLGENESPDMLNVEVDPRGGFFSRRGWDRWNGPNIAPEATWNPRAAYVHELDNGTDHLIIANDGKLFSSANGTFTVINRAAGTPLEVAAERHLADFAPWGNTVYISCGKTLQSAKWSAAGNAVRLTATGTGTWNNNILTPVKGRMPKADLVAAHAGYLWVACTEEDGQPFPHRVRWSHPNNPEDWRQLDFIDILEGGGHITALVPHEDHLLIFKTSSVWALYGYDENSWQLVNVSRSVGAIHRQVVARSETAVYFVSWPQGVHAVVRGKLVEVSQALRPAFTSPKFNRLATNNMWLGWLNQRLWWGVPYWEDGVAEDARSVFVLDPSIGERGAWMLFRSSMNEGLGPFAQGGYAGGDYKAFGVCRCGPAVVVVDALDAAFDTLTGSPVPYRNYYKTRWLHAGWPDLKKSWRRPTFVVRETAAEQAMTVSVYADYDEANPRRAFQIRVGGDGGGWLYDQGVRYDIDGARYGLPPSGATLERGSSLGPGRAMQLKIEGGREGHPWGVNAIVMKFLPRRFK